MGNRNLLKPATNRIGSFGFRSTLTAAMSATALICGLSLASCKDDLGSDDHYKPPTWLKGNAYEVLQSEADYSQFLKCIELSDYKDIVDGKSILTVVAPNNAAFSSFLAKKGVSSVEELDAQDHEYINKLVGYHLMYYAYDWNKMVNFRPTDGDGATSDQLMVNAGYYFKHRTHCQDPIVQQRVKMTPDASTDTLLNIYHYERYLPVFSNKMFETKQIDAASNYSYFFPDTEWAGTPTAAGVFNIANARVLDSEAVVTDNGYLYHVDHVVEPMKTIYDELADNPSYSKYLQIYDSYSTYELADEETMTSLGYQVYLHSHGDLPPIAWEWPTKNWRSAQMLELECYNLFVPTNAAIDRFFDKFWTAQTGYTSIESLDKLILKYFIAQSFAPDILPIFPDDIRQGKVTTSLNTPVDFDPESVTDRKFCANGTLYGMANMELPAIFSSVVGPAFQDSRFIAYLYALDASSSMMSLSSKDIDFVTLMPTEEQMANTEPSIRLYSTNTGKVLQQFNSELGDYDVMSGGAMKNMTDMHIAQNVKELVSTGTQVVATSAAYNYWFVKDGRITTNALFNQQLEPTYTGDPFVDLHPILNDGHAWDNGSSYTYDASSLFEKSSGDGIGHYLAVCQDKNYSYYMFAQLLQKAGLVSGSDLSLVVSGGERYIVFAPTNAAITEHLSEIPGCSKLTVNDGTLSGTLSANDKASLSKYLLQYFVSALMNSFTDYPFLGSSCKGEFYSSGSEKLVITDNGQKLSVGFASSGKTVDVIPDYNYLPFAFGDGCLHFIDGILQ